MHTPGPWTLETVRTSSGLCHKIGPFPWRKDTLNHACIYDDGSHENGMPELVANARLIAAAPDLLEALEGMIAANPTLRSHPIGAPGSAARARQDEQNAAEDAAFAALKKAKP